MATSKTRFHDGSPDVSCAGSMSLLLLPLFMSCFNTKGFFLVVVLIRKPFLQLCPLLRTAFLALRWFRVFLSCSNRQCPISHSTNSLVWLLNWVHILSVTPLFQATCAPLITEVVSVELRSREFKSMRCRSIVTSPLPSITPNTRIHLNA